MIELATNCNACDKFIGTTIHVLVFDAVFYYIVDTMV